MKSNRSWESRGGREWRNHRDQVAELCLQNMKRPHCGAGFPDDLPVLIQQLTQARPFRPFVHQVRRVQIEYSDVVFPRGRHSDDLVRARVLKNMFAVILFPTAVKKSNSLGLRLGRRPIAVLLIVTITAGQKQVGVAVPNTAFESRIEMVDFHQHGTSASATAMLH